MQTMLYIQYNSMTKLTHGRHTPASAKKRSTEMMLRFLLSLLHSLYFISSLTSLKHFTIKSISSFVWLAHTCVRILAFPFGTTG